MAPTLAQFVDISKAQLNVEGNVFTALAAGTAPMLAPSRRPCTAHARARCCVLKQAARGGGR